MFLFCNRFKVMAFFCECKIVILEFYQDIYHVVQNKKNLKFNKETFSALYVTFYKLQYILALI